MSRNSEYCEWSIDAAPIMFGKLYRACAVIECHATEEDYLGKHFVFSNLGDFETREQAETRSTASVKRWIDENYGNG